MEKKTGYFEAGPGNKSNSRLSSFIVIMVALVYAGGIIYLGKENIVEAALSASGMFVAMTAPFMVFLHKQKKEEPNGKPTE